jgi:hypothetical protein
LSYFINANRFYKRLSFNKLNEKIVKYTQKISRKR